MPKQKFRDIKWEGESVQCYYDVPSMGNDRIRKYYYSFIKNGCNYNKGDYAIFSTHMDDPLSQKICALNCLFEEENECKAVVTIYERAEEFQKYFHSLNIAYDQFNDIVLDTRREEKIINLNCILRKCRIIFAVKDESVKKLIDEHNLSRNQYFVCRYIFTHNEGLVPLLNDQIKNDITIESISEKKGTPLKTPSRKIMSASRSIGVKKAYLEPIEDEDIKNNSPHLTQVRRNLNSSFDESQDENSFLNYSIVEQDEKNLKIKLRVSNGKVLSKIPSLQPVVLLNAGKPLVRDNSIYELKSPSFRSILKKSEDIGFETREQMKQNRTPAKVLSEMVEDMNIKDKTPVKLTPRKLRRLERPLYNENYSDSEDSDNLDERRKLAKKAIIENLDRPAGVRRSSRVKKSSFYLDYNYLSGVYCNEGTPKSVRKRKLENQVDPINLEVSDSDSDGNDKSTTTRRKVKNGNLSTPSTKRIQASEIKTSKRTPKTPKTVKGTPMKMIRNGILTPSVDQRLKVVEKCATPLILARNTLHVSYVPKLLPCREKEYRDIYNFIDGKLREKCGGCMYISGVPGTGKTATVTAAIENIIKTWKSEGCADFNSVSINGMKLTEPRQCYVEILKQLTGKRVPWEQALAMLEKQFTTKSKKVVPTVLLIDELDILCTKRQDVVYNLLDWPTKTNAQLIVVTIANTMDLPERLLMSRVTSRLGLTRLTFQAYTHKQLQEIVINRLSGNESFRADAIQFVARKVASVSGDARRALDICRRSAEIAEQEGPNTQVSMQHVNAALEAMITQPKVKAILHCSKLEKLLLKAVIAEVERTGLEETIFEDVCTTLNSLATLEGFKMVSLSLVTAAVYRLTSCRLLLSDQNCNGLDKRILLNVSSDDVYFALKKD